MIRYGVMFLFSRFHPIFRLIQYVPQFKNDEDDMSWNSTCPSHNQLTIYADIPHEMDEREFIIALTSRNIALDRYYYM